MLLPILRLFIHDPSSQLVRVTPPAVRVTQFLELFCDHATAVKASNPNVNTKLIERFDARVAIAFRECA